MPTSDLYEHYTYYNKAETEFEKKLAADRLLNYFENTKSSVSPADRCKAAAVAEILGRCYFRLNNSVDTEYYFLESIRLFKTLGLDVNAAHSAVQLAMFYLTKDRQREAQDMLEYYESQQRKHFGEGHFRHVNASEMRVTVLEKRVTPPMAVPLAVA
jgi:hypothetical protein